MVVVPNLQQQNTNKIAGEYGTGELSLVFSQV